MYAKGGRQSDVVRFSVTQSLVRASRRQRAVGRALAPLAPAWDVGFERRPGGFAGSETDESGAPLLHDGDRGQGLDLMGGALDGPDDTEIALHYGVESQVGWLHLADKALRHKIRPGGLPGAGPETIASRQFTIVADAQEDQA